MENEELRQIRNELVLIKLAIISLVAMFLALALS